MQVLPASLPQGPSLLEWESASFCPHILTTWGIWVLESSSLQFPLPSHLLPGPWENSFSLPVFRLEFWSCLLKLLVIFIGYTQNKRNNEHVLGGIRKYSNYSQKTFSNRERLIEYRNDMLRYQE